MNTTPENVQPDSPDTGDQPKYRLYRIQFRENEQVHASISKILTLSTHEIVMVHTDHGLEPAMILEISAYTTMPPEEQNKPAYTLVRRANRDELDKYNRLIERELEAFELCRKYIRKHSLAMKLIKVERFFNGSKIIFYFTAESRVDFRELVKDLVQEFRTRVEIRQIGVRHETKLIGGIGCCGRELCCSSFINNFAPVSIKMAKEQDLPLNPAKISGICNRLLCCLTYEFSTYKKAKKNMPKPGKTITLDGHSYKVIQNNALQGTITILDPKDPSNHVILSKEEWEKATTETPQPSKKQKKHRQQNKPGKNKPTSGKKS